jgi:SAM-dependent methyltransferase
MVRSIAALEPNDGMHDLAVPRIRASRIPVVRVIGRGESLPFLDRRFDTAVSTLTLCSVSDPMKVLGELRRVLREDGQLILVEHGLSDDPALRAGSIASIGSRTSSLRMQSQQGDRRPGRALGIPVRDPAAFLRAWSSSNPWMDHDRCCEAAVTRQSPLVADGGRWHSDMAGRRVEAHV